MVVLNFIHVAEGSVSVLQRINYGVVFQPTSDIVLAQDTWYHTFELKLPEIINMPSLPTCRNDNDTCKIVAHVLEQLNNLRIETVSKMNETLSTILDLVPESKIHKSRSKRSLLPFVGKLSKGLFGTATMDDVNILASHINKLTKLNIGLSATLSQHEEHLSSYITAANSRMDNLMAGVKDNMLAIKFIQTQLYTTEVNLQRVIDYSMGILIDQINTANSLLNEFEEMKLGVLDLLNGKLSPLLIKETDIQETLSNIKSLLLTKYNGFHLAVYSIADVYSDCKFLFARNGTKLYITIKFPISYFETPLKMFEILSVPVPIKSTSKHATQLLDLPRYFVITSNQQHYTTLSQNDLDKCVGKTTKLCVKNVALLPVTSPSCILALYANNKAQVISKCDFRFVHNAIESNIIEISPNSLLLYRTPLLSMECTKTHKMVKGCDFCIFKLPCKCSVSTNGLYFVPRLGSCHRHVNNSIAHPVNLAVLQHMFSTAFVENIFADTMFKNLVNVSLPELKLYQHKMTDVLAVDTKQHLSLSKMAEIVKKDGIIFKSLTEPLLTGEIKLDTDWPTTDNILTYCSIGAIVLLLILLLGTMFKVRKLAIMVATLQNAKNTHAFVTDTPSFIFTKKADSEYEQPGTTFTIDLTLDQANFILLCVIVCYILTVVYRYFRFKRVSKLCLEVTCGQQCVLVDLVQLPMCPTHFKVTFPEDVNNLEIQGYFSPKLFVSWPGFAIKNVLTNKFVNVTNRVKLSPFTAAKLRSILKRPYHVYIYKVHHGIMVPLSPEQ